MPESITKIDAVVPTEKFESFEAKALENIGKEKEFTGFRKGTAPAEMVKKSIPEMVLLEEMAAMAIGEQFAEIVRDNKLEPLGRPHITISKIAKGNPLEYNILVSTLPELPKNDYKKIAKDILKEEKEEVSAVTDVELEETMRTIQKMRIHDELHASGDNSVHTHDHPELKDENLPPLDDVFAQSIGNFKDLEELKGKLKENILEEKKLKQKSDRRTRVAEALIKETTVELPRILVSAEQEQLFQTAKHNIADAGLKFEDYIKQIGKTEEEMRADFVKDAEKRVTLALVVRDIAKANSLFPDKEEIDREVELIMSQYQGADRDRAEAYIEDVLTKEAVMKFLEE